MRRDTFVEYKYAKSVYEYNRSHAVMIEASEAARANPADRKVPSHRAFKAFPTTERDLRFVAEDLLSAIISCWDGLVEDLLRQRHHTGTGGLQKRLKLLRAASPREFDRLTAAWTSLFEALNAARNSFQHDSYWQTHFGGGQGNSPFLFDLIHPTDLGNVYLLRDSRRAIHELYALNNAWALGHSLDAPTDPCSECGADVLLLGKTMVRNGLASPSGGAASIAQNQPPSPSSTRASERG